MDEFYYEESNPKHVFFKCLIIVFIIGLALGIFYYNKSKHTLKLKRVTVEVGEKLSKNVIDYISSGEKFADDYKLYLDDVDTSKVGKYSYKVKYNKHIEKGIINVVDTVKPIVEVNDITMGIDEELDLDMLISKCDDSSLPCKVSLKNENILNKLKNEGIYEVEIIVTDAVGNKTEKSVKITSSATLSMSSLHTSDLNYYTNSENDVSIGDTLFIEFEKAINEETLEYEGLIQELSSLDFSEYVSDDKEIYDVKLITAYNKYSYVIGFQVLVTFTDGTQELLEKKGD